MRRYGLIGFPLGHSFSKGFFAEKFAREGIADACYDTFPLAQIGELANLLNQHPDLQGFNVTIPYKEAVIPYLTRLDATAAAVGAVNCVHLTGHERVGYNTDVLGFGQSLRGVQGGRWAQAGQHALILGTGGAAKAVEYVLRQLGHTVQYVSRTPADASVLAYTDLRDLSHIDLIVNTTPLGMSPHTERCPDIPYEQLTARHLVFDLIYNPAQTLLLQRAAASGAATQNGLEMLHLQAEASWAIWNGQQRG